MVLFSQNIILVGLWLQYLLYLIDLKSYSIFAFTFFIYAIKINKDALPIAVCLVSAAFTTFNISRILNQSSIEALRYRYSMSLPYFIIGDFILHIFPIILVYNYYWSQAIIIIKSSQKFSGLTSIFFHVSWIHFHGLDMNTLYVYQTHKMWLLLWNIAVFTHIGVMNLLEWNNV
jgi:hypothetical protein